MTEQEYYLLRFIDSVRAVSGRKKLQKIVFIMKYIGFPIDFRYSWHYYGPYSSDLALKIDSLVNQNLLEETISIGYGYKISSTGAGSLLQIEKNPANRKTMDFISTWLDDFIAFSQYGASDLEKAASVLFWREWGKSPEASVRTAENLKGKLSSCAIRIIKKAEAFKASRSSI